MAGKSGHLGDVGAIADGLKGEPTTPDLGDGFEPSPTRDDGTTIGPDQQPKPEPTPDTESQFTINYGGHDVQLSREELIAYAQKGLDYETKMGALKQDKEGFDSFKAWEKYLDERPDLKDFWMTLCNSYEEHGGQLPRLSWGDDDDYQEPQETSSMPSEYERRIADLESRLNAQQETESQRLVQELMGRVQWAIQQNPYLKHIAEVSQNKIGKDIVTERLIEHLQRNPGSDLNILTRIVENELKAEGETLGATAGDPPKDEGQPEPFKTVKPSATPTPGTFTPPGGNAPEGTKDDLKSGAIRKGVEAYLASRNIG